MVKFLILGVVVAGAGAAGYFGERFMRPTKAPPPQAAAMEKKDEDLFKLPLGSFTMQIIQSQRVLHLVFDIDVYVQGAKKFQEINGAVGRAKLRDATVTLIAELAETDPSLTEPMDDVAQQQALAAKIVRKLYVNFPMIRTARINKFNSNISARQ